MPCLLRLRANPSITLSSVCVHIIYTLISLFVLSMCTYDNLVGVGSRNSRASSTQLYQTHACVQQ